MNAGWTAEQRETVKRLWGDGVSSAMIGRMLGRTRNAIVGVVHRMGLPQRDTSKSLDGRTQAIPKRRATVIPRQPRVKRAATPVIAPDEVVAAEYTEAKDIKLTDFDLSIPLGQRCTLLELTEDTCRWPIGRPGTSEFFFCGGHAPGKAAYCSYHSRIAYTPPPQRKPRKTFVPRRAA